MKNKKLLSALLVLSFAVAGCTAQTTTTNTTTSSATINGAETVQLSISDKDLDTTYDLSDTETIELSDSNGTLEISKGGNYLITGSTSNGMITIDVAEDEDVHLILKDVTIANPENSAIFIKSADEVYITLEGTNVLSNGGTFSTVDDEELDSVIYCKTDLTINGDGSLEIVSPAGHAIVCKDDMVITGGTYSISAGEDGINTNDSLAITNGVFRSSSIASWQRCRRPAISTVVSLPACSLRRRAYASCIRCSPFSAASSASEEKSTVER